MPSSVLVLQHAQPENLGIFEDLLTERSITPQYVQSFAGEKVPIELAHHSGLIVLGGPMGVYEEKQYPFLSDERKLIEHTLKDGKPLLGVCLGSQLIASVLGAEVTKGAAKEIGWHTLKLTPSAWTDALWENLPREFMGFHWHGDVFSLPHGATLLASSNQTQKQAFRYSEKVYAFLFHLEVTAPLIEGMTQTFQNELAEANIDGGKILEATPQHLPALQEIGRKVFERWLKLLD